MGEKTCKLIDWQEINLQNIEASQCCVHTSLPCLSLALWVCSNVCPLSHLCHPTISSSVAALSSCPQYFSASGSSMSWLFSSVGPSIGASASASTLPKNIEGWFPLVLTGLIPLLSKGFSRVFSSTTIWKYQSFSSHPSLWSNSHIYKWLLEKTNKHSFDCMDLCKQCVVSVFNSPSRSVISSSLIKNK